MYVIPGPPQLLQIWLEVARKQAPPQSQCPSLLSLSRAAVPVAKAQDNTGAAAREEAGFVGVLWALPNVLDCL
ncbi:hypothetical protein MRX96_019238 [Rhipicephalus microplus]